MQLLQLSVFRLTTDVNQGSDNKFSNHRYHYHIGRIHRKCRADIVERIQGGIWEQTNHVDHSFIFTSSGQKIVMVVHVHAHVQDASEITILQTMKYKSQMLTNVVTTEVCLHEF